MTDHLEREETKTAEAEPAKTPGTGSSEQTFLVGENIYIRSFAPGDEKTATRWRRSVFPKSPELVEKWIKEDLPKEGKKNHSHFAIVRKVDDEIVGSLQVYHGTIGKHLDPHVDPLYGEAGQQWLQEAIVLVADWMIEECYVPVVNLTTNSHATTVIASALANGFVETARWREMLELNGQRFDRLHFSRFSPEWVDRVGNPVETELPRSGTGQPRAFTASQLPENDPPKQAVMVGKRVYLRPVDKKDAANYVKGWRLETETIQDVGRPLRSEAGWAEFISSQAGEDFPTEIWFTVCLLENDEAIGGVGLLDVDYVNRVAETGSEFHMVEHRGKGYGSEAKQLLLEYTFERLGFHMVNSFVLFHNTRSAAALRKQGYTESGRVCWLYPYEGGFGNMVTFDLLADEWRALPREA